MARREWEELVPDEDRRIFEAAGYHEPQPFGHRPVLLVVDVVVSFTGTTPRPVMDAIGEYATSCGESAWQALPRIAALCATARSSGCPIVYTKGNPTNKTFCADSTKDSKSPEEILRRFGAPIHPAIAPEPGEFVLEKTKASAFFATPLPTYLARVGADCLVVCGTSTSGCVRATAVDGWSYGYPVFVVEDCCFDRSRFFHLTALYDLNAKYANVIDLDDANAALAQTAAAGALRQR